ncbi:S-layer homology domain-containing protein [uncultured Oscillibacter sp.]|uniref:S-layer homology domain-containing protein n=1 Tax=uncultured Oscillibacter sp. TaxID=876091 RepID=UPI002605576D|nr:S-layer homology domain-containing protein [uncultured Oscillibacter sp.]
MRKKFISLMLALALCLGLAVPVSAAGFSDVPASHWAYEQINQAVADGIVGGYADGTFKPSGPVSYAAFSLMLARAFYPGELAAYSGSGAGETVMNQHGILKYTGRQLGTVSSGGQAISREDMALCMYNLLVDKGAGIPSVQEQSAAMASIRDFNDIEYNCRKGVLVCYALGLLTGQGDGSFGPKNSMNRAQAAVVIGRLRDYVQSNGGETAGVMEISAGTEPKAPSIQTLANGQPITEENILAILEEIKEEYPSGTSWAEPTVNGTLYNNYGTSPQINPLMYKYITATSSVYACGGFVAMCDYRIFGPNDTLPFYQIDLTNIRPGDVIVQLDKNGESTHYIYACSRPYTFYQYTLVATGEGNVSNKVAWRDCEVFKNDDGAHYVAWSRYPT